MELQEQETTSYVEKKPSILDCVKRGLPKLDKGKLLISGTALAAVLYLARQNSRSVEQAIAVDPLMIMPGTPIPTLDISMVDRPDLCPPRVTPTPIPATTHTEAESVVHENESTKPVISTDPADYRDQVAMEEAGIEVQRERHDTGSISEIKSIHLSTENFHGDYNPNAVRVLLVGSQFTESTDAISTMEVIKKGLQLAFNGFDISVDILDVDVRFTLEKLERSISTPNPEEMTQLIKLIKIQVGREYNIPIVVLDTDEWIGSSHGFSVIAGKTGRSGSYIAPHELAHQVSNYFWVNGRFVKSKIRTVTDSYDDVYRPGHIALESTMWFTDPGELRITRPDLWRLIHDDPNSPIPLNDSGNQCWGEIVFQTGDHTNTIMGDWIPTMEELVERIESGGSPFTLLEQRLIQVAINNILRMERGRKEP